MKLKRIIKWYLSLLFSVQKIVVRKFYLKNYSKDNRVLSNIFLKEFELALIDKLLEFHDKVCTEWNFLFTREDIIKRISEGHKCYIAVTNENVIVGFYWIGINSLYSPDLRAKVSVSEDSIISYNGFVDKTCRGLGVFPKMRNMAYSDFFNKGYKYAYGYSLSTNNAIASSSKKYGFKNVGKAYLGFIFGYHYIIRLFEKECLLKIEKL
ncbi:MAG: hypothetical protein RBR53_03415 [Desulforegulaceae bacterium]|nr:hypothetical protein [Desulforegulaceae bacterium]